MPGTSDHQSSDRGRAGACPSCGASMSADQRYCVDCGAGRGPLPSALDSAVAGVIARATAEPTTPPVPAPAPSPRGFAWMPSPRAAAVAVMGMLALGVILGSVTSKVAQSADLATILVEVPEPKQQQPVAPEQEVEAAPEEEAAPEAVAPEEQAAEPAAEEPVPEAPVEEAPLVPFDPEEDAEPPLPDVSHVFMIVLGENSFDEAFGTGSAAPYLGQELPSKGGLLSNYYSVAPGELANEIALISGQGPTPETVANCPNYADLLPGTETAAGQVEGNGCLYPATTKSLPGQLTEAGLEWKAYVEDIGAAGEPASCRHPLPGTPDAKRAAVPGDAYLTWRNPFVYFHSIVDGTECAERDVGLDQLAPDLKSAKKTPTLSYIVPDACHDGGLVPCEPGLTAGPAETEAFLREVVPQILKSPAYKDDGLIAITSTQAQQTGPAADDSACCVYPEYPNLPPAAAEEPIEGSTKASGGGGRVGLLLLSPFIEPGTVDEGYFNHYSLLLTIAELLELEKLGYANEPSLTPFGSTVFTAAAEEAPAADGGKGSGGDFFGRAGW